MEVLPVLQYSGELEAPQQPCRRYAYALGAGPDPEQERKRNRIGKTLRALCKVSGWFMPMYAAGRLESYNVIEYEDAANYARLAGYGQFAPSLIEMANVEREHERYFRLKVESHFFRHIFPKWKIPQ